MLQIINTGIVCCNKKKGFYFKDVVKTGSFIPKFNKTVCNNIFRFRGVKNKIVYKFVKLQFVQFIDIFKHLLVPLLKIYNQVLVVFNIHCSFFELLANYNQKMVW